MKKLLTLKHWQLFGLLALFLIIYVIGTLLLYFFSWAYMFMFLFTFLIFPILKISVITFFFGWFYALGVNLDEKVPPGVNLGIKQFKICLSIPFVYMLLIFGFEISMFLAFKYPSYMLFLIDEQFRYIERLLKPLSAFCILYCIYFNAKALRVVELQAPVTLRDYAGYFFSILFLPIGIWEIQPRVNKLFDTTAADIERLRKTMR